MDYGTFTPIQVAAISALEGRRDCVAEICSTYRSRRDIALRRSQRHRLAGREAEGDDVRLGEDSEAYRAAGSLEFAKKLIAEARVARWLRASASATTGDDHVRFGLIENEHRTRQAIRGSIRDMFRSGTAAPDSGACTSVQVRFLRGLHGESRQSRSAGSGYGRGGTVNVLRKAQWRKSAGAPAAASSSRMPPRRTSIRPAPTTGIRLGSDAYEVVNDPRSPSSSS